MTEININVMVERVTEKIYEKDPTLIDRYGDKGRAKCIEDNHHHFKHLETAFELNNSIFFTDYAVWLNGILQKFGMSTELLMDNFDFIIEVLRDELQNQPLEVRRFDTYIECLSQAKHVLSEQSAAH